MEEILRLFCTKYSADFRATCSDNPSQVVVVTACKKSEVRVTRSGNVATVCAINSKNGTAVEHAYYEHSTNRAGPFFHRLNLNGAPWHGRGAGRKPELFLITTVVTESDLKVPKYVSHCAFLLLFCKNG